MPKIWEGDFDARNLKVALVVSRFNSFLSDRLVEGALDALQRHGAQDKNLELVRVPGSFELPAVVRRLAERGHLDAIVVLGVLVRGGTPHFDLIAAEVYKGVAQVSMQYPVAIGMGVVTADTLEQAIERAGTKMGNKGFDAALAAIEMANLHRHLK